MAAKHITPLIIIEKKCKTQYYHYKKCMEDHYFDKEYCDKLQNDYETCIEYYKLLWKARLPKSMQYTQGF